MNSSKFLSVGIDVGSAFSWMAIVDPQGNVISKPFKLIHNSLDSLNAAVLRIRKAEETESLKAAIFLESTGIYHIDSVKLLWEFSGQGTLDAEISYAIV